MGKASRQTIIFRLDDAEYHLTPEQADVVDEQDRNFPATREGNEGFNLWFKEYARKQGVRAVNKRLAAYWTNTKNTNDTVAKAALTLRAMRTLMSVVDPEHRLNLTFKPEAETSAWQNNEVYLPTKPLEETDDLYEAINLMGGFAVHEAGHSKHTRLLVTRQGLYNLRVPDEAMAAWLKDPVNMTLANLLEDERTEALEMVDNPGHRAYLNNVKEWVWKDQGGKLDLPPTWAECTPEEKLSAAIATIRYADRTDDMLDASYRPVVDAIRTLSNEYRDKGESVSGRTMQEAVEEFISTLNITADDREKMKEKAAAGLDPMEGQPKLSPCNHVHDDEGMSVTDATEVEALVDQEIERLDNKDPRWAAKGSMEFSIPTITVLRPRVKDPTLMPKADDLLNKAKAALEFRRAVPRPDTRMMTSGELDEDELYRLVQGDMRVFRDVTEEVEPSACVYLLVDLSGSMYVGFGHGSSYSAGMRIDVAQKVAYLLLRAMKAKANLRVRVLGHTGDNDALARSGTSVSAATFYRIWEEGDPMNRLSTIRTIRAGQNYDSFAVAWAGDMLAEENAEQKVLIVLSDGEPAGRSYGGYPAREHVRLHTDRLMRKGIDVINVAMTTDLSDDRQAEMYRHYVPANDGPSMYSDLLRSLQRIIQKVSR